MKIQRVLSVALGAILIVFGLACVNYTKPSGLEHHREWAAQHNAPPPNDTILIGGVVGVGAGVGLIGLGVSRRRVNLKR